MQITAIDKLLKQPTSHTAGTLAVLVEAREELVKKAVACRQHDELTRLQGSIEFADLVISKLDKNKQHS